MSVQLSKCRLWEVLLPCLFNQWKQYLFLSYYRLCSNTSRNRFIMLVLGQLALEIVDQEQKTMQQT